MSRLWGLWARALARGGAVAERKPLSLGPVVPVLVLGDSAPAGGCTVVWLQPFPGLGGVPGPPADRFSPIHLHRPPQMTAWAYSNWTSGPTSPSSPIRPASESEQSELPAAAATATGRTRGCRHHPGRGGGGFFF